jgi:hypothetical protein
MQRYLKNLIASVLVLMVAMGMLLGMKEAKDVLATPYVKTALHEIQQEVLQRVLLQQHVEQGEEKPVSEIIKECCASPGFQATIGKFQEDRGLSDEKFKECVKKLRESKASKAQIIAFVQPRFYQLALNRLQAFIAMNVNDAFKFFSHESFMAKSPQVVTAVPAVQAWKQIEKREDDLYWFFGDIPWASKDVAEVLTVFKTLLQNSGSPVVWGKNSGYLSLWLMIQQLDIPINLKTKLKDKFMLIMIHEMAKQHNFNMLQNFGVDGYWYNEITDPEIRAQAIEIVEKS